MPSPAIPASPWLDLLPRPLASRLVAAVDGCRAHRYGARPSYDEVARDVVLTRRCNGIPTPSEEPTE